ncbi:serine/threonine protein kinase [Myxococcus stipitatus DSM 14675]|uniref:Serine/threonine protein kinase n=1 Tax=Myxococcus stipitatus (strain DSM 14675 / JCM 12634 / Mx s8) TaxID=1278073 RepID=L7UMH7_MYXSD|nr:serine/threonine-protein kinase [Myxococcus stipitatus]AGC49218.1 serine/threonine protein kinase [Myxococcus stipitatus DSM 14675]
MRASGTRVGEYVIVNRVAVGGSSDVYQARHPADGSWAAVKMLTSEASLQKEVVARFLNEAQTLQQLRHPYLVKVLALGETPEDGAPFLVMEWLPVSLLGLLRERGGHLSLGDSVGILRQLSQVLLYLHERGVIHRDVKPENVLVAPLDRGTLEVRLADLGLARRVLEAGAPVTDLYVSTAKDALLGTGEYMAPEQWRSPKGVDAKVDVYALGVLGFHLLAGEPPFVAETHSGLQYQHVVKPPPLGRLEGVAPEGLRSLLGAMLAKVAGRRPSMAEVLRSLDALAN